MFHTILICSDGSEPALQAVRTGAMLARHFGSEVLALHVCEAPIPVVTQAGPTSAYIGKSVSDQYIRQQAQVNAAQMRSLLAEEGNCYRILQEVGHPVGSIVEVAKREQVDLIVMGCRGRTGIQELLLGSVSTGVLHHAPCSVLIVRGEHTPCGLEGFRHILLASDASESAIKATRAAVEVAEKFATSLTVLKVIEPLSHLPVIEGQVARWAAEMDADTDASRLLEPVKRSVKQIAMEAGVYCSYYQERGPAQEVIVCFAQWHRADLIVLGSRGLSGFARLMQGSVSNDVAHYAHCPVLIVR